MIVNDQGMSLQIATLKTPIGTLNLIADGEVLVGVTLGVLDVSFEASGLKCGLDCRAILVLPAIGGLAVRQDDAALAGRSRRGRWYPTARPAT